MPEIVINGIPIRFPFEPYDLQRDYMTKVIECLQSKSNGALESPTGTGKTLCLLCATLGWLEYKKANMQAEYAAAVKHGLSTGFNESQPMQTVLGGGFEARAIWGGVGGNPKIIYSSRTHSQLSQAIAELKRTSYSYMKVAVLGSRDQLCIHPEVSKELNNSSKLHMCQIRVKAKTCYFHNQVEGKKDDPFLKAEALDLEDLVKYGKRHTCCPYYLARDLRIEADVIFMPYNYLLDPKTRKAHAIELQGNVVILDEAHNVEKICEESASLQLCSTDIALCIDEVTQVMRKMEESGGDHEAFAANDTGAEAAQDFTLEDLYILKTLFLQFEKVVDAIPLTAEGKSHPGNFMFDLLEKAEVVPGKKNVICDLLDKLVQYLTSNSNSPFQRKGAGLQKFSDLLKVVFSKDNFTLAHMESITRSYKVHVGIEESRKPSSGWGGGGKQGASGDDSKGGGGGWGSYGNRGGGTRSGGWGAGSAREQQSNTLTSKQGRVLSYWCFNPGFGMKELMEQGLRCIIITSGTLSPLQSFTDELQVGFPVQLENPHIIKGHQVLVGVVSKGPDGHILNSSYQNRSRPEYLNSLGQLLLNYSKVVPGGLLVFFPSYPIMRSCHEHWQFKGIWDKIVAVKPAFIEPKGKDGFVDTMQEFYEKVNSPQFRGAIFMAVCRGKVSEGLDFADGNGRAVIITGLPYPPFKDPRIMLKQQYLDAIVSKERRGQSGQAWYRQEASRAVNQAIGRVIRHRDDYGAILLADHRFGAGGFVHQLSRWVQPHLKVYQDFGPTIRDITRFFRAAEALLPQPQSRSTYNRKEGWAGRSEGGGGGNVKAEYDPLPAAATPSTAFSQGPSRLLARYNGHSRDPAVGTSEADTGAGDSVSQWQLLSSSVTSSVNNTYSSVAATRSVLDSLHSSDSVFTRETATNGEVGDKAEPSVSSDDTSCVSKKRARSTTTSSSVLDFNSINAASREHAVHKSKYSDLLSIVNRKKIKVAVNVCNDQNTAPTNTLKNEGSNTSKHIAKSASEKASADHRLKIVSYLKKVKSSLPPTDYEEFSSAIRIYQTKQDVDALLVLFRIFKDEDKHHFLEGFSAFVKSKDRQQFGALCKSHCNK